ncbi:hypothetical protein [Streptomyces sp. NBC_00525]|uniref:hypothetical protein n=1 Tax=Streptomyces sp. NBC_00525 TaxID=2903660 RepID=UPI002E7FD1B2|nr:hypothetical protein [Streptomyces sp. NBC_00525]WUC96300.1 hypothetical protein OG710_23055 [Streptomyces sp. NBC_00525]
MNRNEIRRIPFIGAREADERATWGQSLVWRDMSGMAPGTPYNETNGTLVPPGLGTEDVVDALGALLSRHEALRTVWAEDASGGLRQRVLARGEVTVEVHRLPDGGPEAVARFVASAEPRLRGTVFDTSGEPAFRAAVAVGGDGVVAVLIGVAKLAVDLQGSRLVVRDLRALLDARTEGRPWPPPLSPAQPVDIARDEGSERGRATTRRAVRHAVTQVSRFPARVFPVPADRTADRPRFWRGGLVSTAVPRAVAVLSERWKVSGTTLFMTAAATVLATEAATSGGARLPRFGWHLIVGNRIGETLRHTAVTATQDLPLAVDLGGETFSAIARQAGMEALRAYRHGRFDPRVVDEAIRGEGGVGEGRDLACYFNDTRDLAAGPAVAVAAPGRLRRALEESSFRWEEKVDWDAVTVFFEVFDVRERPDALRLSLYADTLQLPAHRIPVVLRAVERLLVTAAVDGDIRTTDVAALCDDPAEGEPAASGPETASSWRIALRPAESG